MNSVQLNQQNPLNQLHTAQHQSDNTQSAYQPQPLVMPSQGNAKMDPRKISMIALSVAILAGAVFGATALGTKNSAESKTGVAYIKALRANDSTSLEAVTDPEIIKVGDKIGELGGSEAKDGFYKSYVTALKQQTGASASGDIKEVKVTKEAADGLKYAYVTYQTGSMQTTVLESYQAGSPKVVTIENGPKTYDINKFKAVYQAHQNQMKQMTEMVQQVAQGAGSNSQQVVQSLFPVK